DDAAERRQNQQRADVDVSAPREPPQGSRFREQQRLANDHYLELAPPIGDDSAIERKQQHRKTARRAHDADEERAVSELEGEPALPDCLHPGANERDSLAGPEESEIAVDLQRPERVDGPAQGARWAGMSHSAVELYTCHARVVC